MEQSIPYRGLFQGVLDDGTVASYGKVYIYDYYTGEAVDSYTNNIESEKNPIPVPLSASGKAEIFLPQGITYEVTLKDQFDEVVWTEIINPDCAGDCFQFRVSDGAGGHLDFIVNEDNYLVGDIHGGCGRPLCEGEEDGLDYGYSCESGSGCPNCFTFNVLNPRRTYHETFGTYAGLNEESDLYNVGLESGGCGEFNPPPDGYTWGLQCDALAEPQECPNCIQFNVLNEAGDGFDAYAGSDAYFKHGFVLGSCAGTAPAEVTDLSATNDQASKITLTWTEEGYPLPTYQLTRNGITVIKDVRSPFDDYFVGIATYSLRSENVLGVDVTQLVQGEGLDIGVPTFPSRILDFTASDNQVNDVICEWSPATGNPTPTYNLYRGGVEVATNITSPYADAFIGTADYHIEAVNSEGARDSNIDSGTGHTTTPYDQYMVEALYLGTIGEPPERFVTVDTEPFMVLL